MLPFKSVQFSPSLTATPRIPNKHILWHGWLRILQVVIPTHLKDSSLGGVGREREMTY